MTAKEYKAHLRQKLKEQSDLTEYYKKEYESVFEDRKKYQQHFTKRFRWFIELLGKGQGPRLGEDDGVIARDAKFLQTVEYFSW